MRRARWKRKNVSAGRSAPARTSCRQREKAGVPVRQSGTETRCPWGNLQLGEVPDTSSVDLRCRWPSLAGQGPTHRSAPTRRWRSLVLRRGGPACPPAGKALHGAIERQRGSGAGAMRRPPRFSAAPRTRGSRPKQTRSPARAGRRPTSLVGTSSEDPRPRGGPLHRSATKRFSLWTAHGPFLFWQDKREMGGAAHYRVPINSPAETGGMRQGAAAAAITGRGTPCRCTSSTSGRCRRGTGRCGRSW